MNPFGKMGDLGQIMKQAQKMLEDTRKIEESLAEERIEASSGGGMVKAAVTGKGEILEVKIDPQVVDSNDVEMLEDLVVTAVREALEQAAALKTEKMKELTGGMGIPGLF
ncbi:MAG: YbaB/EbfC family nucleoid-associated protein [Armatimonadota bacterium]|nr:YbaB/EbfC family nucleoid-associated protein [Armatimonadota bacterium]